MSNVYMGENFEDFIFTEGTAYEEAKTVEPEETAEDKEIAEEMAAFGIIECVDEPEVACYRIALENEQNYNAIMNAFMAKEFSVLESTGEEMVYEAVDVKKFFTAIKEAIARFWAKVQGIFKKLMEYIFGMVASNKQFYNRYKDKKFNAPKKKTFKGYNFGSFSVDYDGIYEEAKKEIKPDDIKKYDDDKAAQDKVKEFTENFKSMADKMRGIAVGKSTATADTFREALKLRFYGSKEKVTLDVKSFQEIIGELGNAMNAKKYAKEAHDAAKKAVKEIQKDIKTAERDLAQAEGRGNSGMKVAKCLTDAINQTISIMSMTLSEQMGAIKTDISQTRAMATYYVTHQEGAVTESAEDFAINLI